jgi:hypothetical protein
VAVVETAVPPVTVTEPNALSPMTIDPITLPPPAGSGFRMVPTLVTAARSMEELAASSRMMEPRHRRTVVTAERRMIFMVGQYERYHPGDHKKGAPAFPVPFKACMVVLRSSMPFAV